MLHFVAIALKYKRNVSQYSELLWCKLFVDRKEINRLKIEEQMQNKNIILPVPAIAKANYLPYLQVGNLVYLSGQGPALNGVLDLTGKVGRDLTFDQGYQAARNCALNLLSQLKLCVGNLDSVKQIVQLKGYVNCDENFKEIPQIINGASDLLVEVFGDKGKHTRCALGSNALPNRIAVEVEMIVELY